MDECLLPPLTLVKSPLVSASALAVPAKAKKEYVDACQALQAKKTVEPNYVPAYLCLAELSAQERA